MGMFPTQLASTWRLMDILMDSDLRRLVLCLEARASVSTLLCSYTKHLESVVHTPETDKKLAGDALAVAFREYSQDIKPQTS